MKANFNNNKIQAFSDEEIKKQKNAIVYDPSAGVRKDGNIQENLDNLPDVPKMLEKITEILECMLSDEMVELKEKNQPEFEHQMELKFPHFSFRYYGTFKQILKGEDLTPLFTMLSKIEKIKSGMLSLDQAENDMGNELAEEYIYPMLPKDQRQQVKKQVEDMVREKRMYNPNDTQNNKE